MTQPAPDLSLSPRERLRWRRAMDSLLVDAIYGRVLRDAPQPPMPDALFVPPALATEIDQGCPVG